MMTEQEQKVFEDWRNTQPAWAMLGIIEETWQAACVYKNNELDYFYDYAREVIKQEQDRCKEQLDAQKVLIAKLWRELDKLEGRD